MAKMLTLDEMLSALCEVDRAAYDWRLQLLVAHGQDIASDLASALDIDPGIAGYFDGTLMVGFAPKTTKQPLPAGLNPFDIEGDWVPRPNLFKEGQANCSECGGPNDSGEG